ncbi:GDSL-type esterase/lipase family protein [Pseudoflavitalea rhizosphaerae]|uniref:GDSL-type esterase/lipase family protein n=1 Tax=Pseudoflavitalea rhizosphaerae TaxID=1884793 RepID=UPI001F4A00C0|nr:GDSL-type esterase/lipase family protein [Pseudoflavitalea rhizosphaerae]
MMKKLRYTCLFVCLLLVVAAQSVAQPFINEIRQFRKQDSISAPPANPIIFTGSSSFRMWKDVKDYFPGYTIVNRGFGGSGLPHVIQYAEDVIFKYNPRQVVIYCGENDLRQDVKGEYVADKFKELFHLIRQRMPGVPIAYVSMKPSPHKEKVLKEMKNGNKLIRKFLKKQKNAVYIDVYSAMLNADGSFRKIYLKDNLHMNAEGYKIWQPLIQKHLIKD